ncbi:MAG: ATP-binding protein [Nitrospinae bacterium]|nr:ATP-binding protein [Nitrospinota bacterium]
MNIRKYEKRKQRQKIIKEAIQSLVPHHTNELISKAEKRRQSYSKTGLHENKTFETFIKSSANEYPLAASLAVAEGSAKTSYNLLFIYGGVDLGKTHLLHAIGNKAYQKNLRVVYLTVEKFLFEMSKSIKKDKVERFRNRYKKYDVLLMDDIEHIAGKEKTQLEFFDIFHYLYKHGKQVVVASNQLPKELKHVDEILISKLNSGLIVDIEPPDLEARIAITKEITKVKEINLSNDVCEWLAKEINNNIWDIEGAITKLGFHSKIANEEITLNLAKSLLINQEGK